MAVLPDDITITAASQTSRVNAAMDNVLTAMCSETKYCSEQLQSLIVDAESKPNFDSSANPPRDRNEGVESAREEFAAIQQQIQSRADAVCDRERVVGFRKELSRLEKKTDAALLHPAQS